jgi:hypothetical protein
MLLRLLFLTHALLAQFANEKQDSCLQRTPAPTPNPTAPTSTPTRSPTASPTPHVKKKLVPYVWTATPTSYPTTRRPTSVPTNQPSSIPTFTPTSIPSTAPSHLQGLAAGEDKLAWFSHWKKSHTQPKKYRKEFELMNMVNHLLKLNSSSLPRKTRQELDDVIGSVEPNFAHVLEVSATDAPSSAPTIAPTSWPTAPTLAPTVPTAAPTASHPPTYSPTSSPTSQDMHTEENYLSAYATELAMGKEEAQKRRNEARKRRNAARERTQEGQAHETDVERIQRAIQQITGGTSRVSSTAGGPRGWRPQPIQYKNKSAVLSAAPSPAPVPTISVAANLTHAHINSTIATTTRSTLPVAVSSYEERKKHASDAWLQSLNADLVSASASSSSGAAANHTFSIPSSNQNNSNVWWLGARSRSGS